MVLSMKPKPIIGIAARYATIRSCSVVGNWTSSFATEEDLSRRRLPDNSSFRSKWFDLIDVKDCIVIICYTPHLLTLLKLKRYCSAHWRHFCTLIGHSTTSYPFVEIRESWLQPWWTHQLYFHVSSFFWRPGARLHYYLVVAVGRKHFHNNWNERGANTHYHYIFTTNFTIMLGKKCIMTMAIASSALFQIV